MKYEPGQLFVHSAIAARSLATATPSFVLCNAYYFLGDGQKFRQPTFRMYLESEGMTVVLHCVAQQ